MDILDGLKAMHGDIRVAGPRANVNANRTS